MTAYVVVCRPDDRFPFCIDRQNGDGSWTTLERWHTKALAFDRMGDIRAEFDALQTKRSNDIRRPFDQPPRGGAQASV